METNNRPYLHPNSDANVINLGSELQAMGLFELALFLQKSDVFFQRICAPLGMHIVTNESGVGT